jgi:membrane protein
MGSMALIFRMGPASHQRGRWVTPGSVFGTIIFLAATLLFREYVLKFASYNRIYGSLGGVMALMFWFWLSSLVLLVAAEMNKVIEYAVTRTKKPTENTKSAGGKEEAPVVKTDSPPEAGPQGQATAVNPETTISPKQANSAGSVDPANGSPAIDGTENVTVSASPDATPVEKNTKGDSNA